MIAVRNRGVLVDENVVRKLITVVGVMGELPYSHAVDEKIAAHDAHEPRTGVEVWKDEEHVDCSTAEFNADGHGANVCRISGGTPRVLYRESGVGDGRTASARRPVNPEGSLVGRCLVGEVLYPDPCSAISMNIVNRAVDRAPGGQSKHREDEEPTRGRRA